MQAMNSLHASSQLTAQPAPALSPDKLGFAPDASWMWSTFVDESSTAIFLVSREGVVEYANLPARTLLSGQPAGNVAGRSLAELLGVEHASERLQHIANVLDSNRVVAMEDMLRGKRLQCVLRPCPPIRGERPTKVIAVAHLSALYAGTQNGYPTVRTRTTDGGRLKDLTAKELEILRLIGTGMSTQEIADALGRSVKTVEWHRVSLGEKLGVDNRVLLARIAIAAGLVSLEDTDTANSPRFDAGVAAAAPANTSSTTNATTSSTTSANAPVRAKRPAR
jgi:DNA-binding CsgD family transcriptional regulator